MLASPGSIQSRFEERLSRVLATTSAVAGDDVRDEVSAVLARNGVGAWLAAPGLPAAWVPDGAVETAAYLALAEETHLDRLGCVEAGILGVAETGSVLTAGPPEVRRLAMLADVQVLVVREEDLVPTLDEAAAHVSAMSPAPPHLSFVTGASRSSDIERTLAIGVHGPAVVHVLVVRR